MKHIDNEIKKTLESYDGVKAQISPEFYSRLSDRIENQSYSIFSFKTYALAFSLIIILGTGIRLGFMYNNAQEIQIDEFEEFVSSYELASSISDYPEFE